MVTGNGTQALDQASSFAAGVQRVRSSGVGALSLRGGSTLSSSQAIVGVAASGVGSATLADAGTRWTNAGQVVLGEAGSANASFAGGAQLVSEGAR